MGTRAKNNVKWTQFKALSWQDERSLPLTRGERRFLQSYRRRRVTFGWCAWRVRVGEAA